MSEINTSELVHLKDFLRSIQRPNLPLDRVGVNDDLVQSGLIDSLAVVQIVAYLEETYNIDFSVRGFDPERLATMANILHFIDEARA
jgi:acyl carrier protein